MDVYSPFKVIHHRKKLDELKNGNFPLPLFIQWDLTNRCNLNCNFCWYKVHKLEDYVPEEVFDTAIAFKVLEELKELGVKAIEWTGGGSVECHPDWKKIIRKANQLGFQQALVTNGTMLDDEGLDLIKGFEWVRFSIDCVDPATYKKIKGVSGFEKALTNARKLLGIRKKDNVVGFSFIVCRDNYNEIYKATKYAKKAGFDNIRFSLAYTPLKEKMFEGIWTECVELIEKAKKLEGQNFKVFSFSNRINEIASRVFSSYCGYHHFVGVIAANGAIYPCCLLKLNPAFNLGNVKENTFLEVWRGKKRKDFIKSIEKGCPYSCWMVEKNKFIEYCLKDNPPHVNFV